MDIGWKIASAGSAAIASLLATRVLDMGWQKAMGHKPPHDVDEPGVDVKEVIAFALISGALIGVARQLALQGASRWYGGPGSKAAEERES